MRYFKLCLFTFSILNLSSHPTPTQESLFFSVNAFVKLCQLEPPGLLNHIYLQLIQPHTSTCTPNPTHSLKKSSFGKFFTQSRSVLVVSVVFVLVVFDCCCFCFVCCCSCKWWYCCFCCCCCCYQCFVVVVVDDVVLVDPRKN